MPRLFILVLFTGLMMSCSSFHFDSYMPNDEPGLAGIDPAWQGRYVMSDSLLGKKDKTPAKNSLYFAAENSDHTEKELFSAEMWVSDKLVYYILRVDVQFKKDMYDLDSLKRAHPKSSSQIKGNHFIFSETLRDTLLNLNANDKLIQYGGNYYFNRFISKGNWEVLQFKKSGGRYFINATSDEDAAQLSEYFKQGQKNELFENEVAGVSAQQFKLFVSKGGFRQSFGFTKITQ